MTNIKNIAKVLGLIVVLVLAFVGLKQTTPMLFGSSCDTYTCYTYLEVLNDLKVDGATSFTGLISVTSLKVGTNGTTQTQQISTSCNPTADTSVAATSTSYIYCTGITGVTSTSRVIAQFATSTNAIGTQWAILGSNASTTAGAVDIKIMNLTGTAAVPSASAGATFASSTKLWIVN